MALTSELEILKSQVQSLLGQQAFYGNQNNGKSGNNGGGGGSFRTPAGTSQIALWCKPKNSWR